MILRLFLGLLLIACAFHGAKAQSGIIYSRDQKAINTGGTADLMHFDLSSGKETMLIKGTVPRRGEYNASASPNGKTISFNTYRYSGWKLALADYEGGKVTKVRRFTNRPNYEYNARWSHAGDRVVYEEYNWGTDRFDLFIMDQKTGKVSKVPNGSGSDRNASWTYDDKNLVFTQESSSNSEIFLSNLGGTRTNLSQNPAQDFASSCSPKANKVAFLSDRSGKLLLYVMNLDGSGLSCLTPDLPSDPFRFSNWQNSNAWAYKTYWSPDGEQIVFNVKSGGDHELFIVNADGTGLKQLTDNDVNDYSPTWVK